MAKQKYYVVWKGKNPGIYNTWEDAKKQIDGFQAALYKSFPSIEEANLAFASNPSEFIKITTAVKKTSFPANDTYNLNSICVDAACSGNPGDMEYRGVLTASGKEIFHIGPLKQGTNNVGEFLAIVHALAYLDKKQRYDIIIYTDSKTAMAWVKNKNPKTKLEKTKANEAIFDLMNRAVNWLNTNDIKNPIIKWETDTWGEIKADFGRK